MDQQRKPFAKGLRDGLPIVIGYIPAGITFGILARNGGVALADAAGFSAIVFAGASQYMALALLQSGAAFFEIVFATLLLNFRHFLMSATLARKLEENRTAVLAVLSFGVTDETFSVASVKSGPLRTEYLAGLELIAWTAWQAGTVTGFLAGTYLPERVELAMGTALYALFAALLAPLVREKLANLVFAVVAGGLNTVLGLIPGLSRGWVFIGSVVAAAAVAAAIPERRGSEEA